MGKSRASIYVIKLVLLLLRNIVVVVVFFLFHHNFLHYNDSIE